MVPTCKFPGCHNLAYQTCQFCNVSYCGNHLPIGKHVCEKKQGVRYYQPSGVDHMIVPDYEKEAYERHVKTRATMFCYLVHSVAHLCLKYKPTKSYEKYLSDKADVQVSEGIYTDDMQIDAAHFCNTSFLHLKFLTEITKPVSMELSTYCANLRRVSGATSPQLKSDNVGPDKVIDSYQTAFKNKYLKKVHDTNSAPSGRHLYFDFVLGLDLHVFGSKSRSFTDENSNSYMGGMHAQLAVLDLSEMVEKGFLDWAIENEFLIIEKTINSLP